MGICLKAQLMAVLFSIGFLIQNPAFSTSGHYWKKSSSPRLVCYSSFAKIPEQAPSYNLLHYSGVQTFRKEGSGSDTKLILQPPMFLRRELVLDPRPHWKNRYYNANSLEKWKGEIETHLEFVFQSYLKRGTVPEVEVKNFMKLESELDPFRTEYFVYEGKGTRKTKSVIQIYFGGPSAGQRSDMNPMQSMEKKSWQLPIEREYPKLILPERETDGVNAHILSLNRLAGAETLDAVLDSQFSRVAARLYDLHGRPLPGRYASVFEFPKNPVIYIETPEVRGDYFVGEGFEIFKTSEQLKSLGGPPGRVILRIPVSQFVKRWYSPDEFKFPKIRE